MSIMQQTTRERKVITCRWRGLHTLWRFSFYLIDTEIEGASPGGEGGGGGGETPKEHRLLQGKIQGWSHSHTRAGGMPNLVQPHVGLAAQTF